MHNDTAWQQKRSESARAPMSDGGRQVLALHLVCAETGEQLLDRRTQQLGARERRHVYAPPKPARPSPRVRMPFSASRTMCGHHRGVGHVAISAERLMNLLDGDIGSVRPDNAHQGVFERPERDGGVHPEAWPRVPRGGGLYPEAGTLSAPRRATATPLTHHQGVAVCQSQRIGEPAEQGRLEW
jgi:hypothetical protein